ATRMLAAARGRRRPALVAQRLFGLCGSVTEIWKNREGERREHGESAGHCEHTRVDADVERRVKVARRERDDRARAPVRGHKAERRADAQEKQRLGEELRGEPAPCGAEGLA